MKLTFLQILERRKKRDAQLEEKHRLEMEEEMTRQQQERDKLKEEIARKVEDQELKKNTKVSVNKGIVQGGSESKET